MKQLTSTATYYARRIKEWWSYYVFWDKHLACVLGMVFSRSLAERAVVGILVWYLSATRDILMLSAILSNTQEGLSSMLEIVVCHVADCVVGRFRTIWFSTSAYMGGLLLLWLFNPCDVKWIILIVIMLLAIGTSGDNVLEDMLKDVVRYHDKSPDSTEKRVLARSKTWLGVVNTCAAGAAVLLVYVMLDYNLAPKWNPVFLICTVAMGISLSLFFVGKRFYEDNILKNRPLHIFFRVSHSAFLKRDLSYSTDPQKYFHDESSPRLSTMPNLTCCRWLANAAKITEGEEGNRKCTLQEVVVVDHLLKMLPIWTTFLVVSVVSATGSTFFIEQYDTFSRPESMPVVVFTIIQDFSAFIILLVYPKVLSICKCRFRKNRKVQMGIGMICSILCCIFAWQLEARRLKRVKKNHFHHGLRGVRNQEHSYHFYLSFAWLIPQFCILGFMEGLAEDGLLKFLKSQVDKSIEEYLSQYIQFVLGIGKLLSIILILIFKQDTEHEQRKLDNYYETLAFICIANLGLYCGITKFFYRDAGSKQEPSEDDSQALNRASC